MKKLNLLIVLMLTIGFGMLQAQTNKGTVLLGVSSTLSLAGTGSDLMNIGISSVKYKSDADGYVEPDPDKMTSFNFLPKAGYFIADNLVLGLDLNIAISSEKDGEDNDKFKRTMISAGPFIRYYIPSTKVLPFIEINSSFGSIKNKYEYYDNSFWDDEEYKTSINSFGGGIGFAAPLGERVTFDVLAGYNSIRIKSKDNNEDNDRSVVGTLGLKLGFTILLGSNKMQ